MSIVVAAMHAEDLKKARRLVRAAITQAGEEWLPAKAVMDALTLELIDMAGHSASPAQIAAHLTGIAAQLKRTHARSH